MELSPTKSNGAVELRSVTKRFGQRVVLDALDLEVAAGETVAIVGPSGSGKSTLLRCINGLCPFDAGEIHVSPWRIAAGGDSRDAVHAVRRALGLVFQDFQLFPHWTVLENVAAAPRYVQRLTRGDAHGRSLALLRRVGLADRAEAYPSELSGGQKQRVAIARALAMQPRGLLCDEITSALDPELKGEVLAVLEDLKREGLTLLVVTHEIGFARRAADRVVVLAEGKVIESGPPSSVLDRPEHPRTRQFLSQVLG